MPNVNYASQYAKELANAYPYFLYFGDIYNNENASKYRPVSGKYVMIPYLSVSGAHAVNRDQITGTFNRNWDNAWQQFACEMDREWDTLVDPMDMSEAGDIPTIANITKTFNEQQKFAEMDAYLAATLGSAAIANSMADSTALTAANILTQWDTYLAAMADARVNRDRLVCYVTPATFKLLKEASGITRFIDAGTGIRNIDRNVGKLDGVRIVEVPSDLMKTAYDFTTGFVAAQTAKQINMLFVDTEAVVTPIVYETSMISAPTAQSKGKYLYYERFYYGAAILNNRKAGVYCVYTA
jgi:hypothetical protein